VIRLAAISLVALLVACTGADDGGPPGGDPAAVIGTGELEFEPLAGGDDIYVVQGPQGGFHLNGSVRVQGVAPGNPDDLVDPDNPTTEFRAFVGDVRVDAGGARYTQGLDPAPAPYHGQMVGRRVILDILDDAELDGATVRFEVTVSDVYGNSASAEVTVTTVPHPNNL
jgi:hypothetical protein